MEMKAKQTPAGHRKMYGKSQRHWSHLCWYRDARKEKQTQSLSSRTLKDLLMRSSRVHKDTWFVAS